MSRAAWVRLAASLFRIFALNLSIGALFLLRACAPAAAGDTGAPVDNRVVLVAAPGATCAAVHEKTQMLIVGHRAAEPFELSLFSLDGRGRLTKNKPMPVAMPLPESLATFNQYVLGVAIHPREDLLYVWRDIAGPKPGTPQAAEVFDLFDRLLIYRMERTGPVMLARTCRGPRFAYEQTFGWIALDPEARRLFLPNLRDASSGASQIGYLPLGRNGLPQMVETEQGERVEAEPISVDVSNLRGHPSGWGFFAPNADVVLFAGPRGVALWDTANRRGALGSFIVIEAPNDNFIGGHHAFPAVYGAGHGHSVAWRMTQVDGFFTLRPQALGVAGANFHSPPVVIPSKPPVLAIGGVNSLHLLSLDAEGRFTGQIAQIAVQCPEVRALACSQRFNRLYVAVEKLE